jgi:8-oxo-dGTP pyrophosphatase MutT (NUDIX family)
MSPGMAPQRANEVYGTIIVSPQNRFLLVRGRATGKWSFPKGHLEGVESPLDCAKRELFEETGLSLKGASPNTGLFKLRVAHYFLFRVSSEFKLWAQDSREVMDLRWFTFDEVQHLSGNVDVSEFVRRMKKNLCY